MRPAFVRAMLFACAALLAACRPSDVADFNTSFTPQSATAVVIVGTQLSGPHLTGFLGIETYPSVSMTWTRTANDDAGKAVVFHSQSAPTAATVEQLRKMNYTVYNLPPGTYALTEIVAVQSSGKVVSTHRTQMVGQDAALGFQLRAGEISYIGSFTIDAISFPAKIESVTRDDQAASDALKLYPSIQGQVQYTRLVRVPVKRGAAKPLTIP